METIAHYNRMLENEIQELTLQLRKAREDISGLTKMLADAERPLKEISGDTWQREVSKWRQAQGDKRLDHQSRIEQTRSGLPPAEAC
nr:hypothetical protein [Pseudomonas sp. TH31]